MIYLILLLQVITCLVVSKIVKNKAISLSVLLCNVSLFMYSCFGIDRFDIDTKYYGTYLTCMLTFNFCFILGNCFCNFVHSKKTVHGVTYGCSIDYFFHKYNNYVKYVAYLYFAIRVIQLFYPEFFLKYLFQGPNFIYSNLLEALRESTDTTFGHILATLSTITLPFAYLYLQKMGTRRIIIFLIFDLIAQYLTGRGSIGRLAIIRNILIVCLVLYISANTKSSRRKIVLCSSIASILCVCLYVIMEYMRNGQSIASSNLNLIQIINYYFDGEFFYPKHYPLAEQLSKQNAYPPIVF